MLLQYLLVIGVMNVVVFLPVSHGVRVPLFITPLKLLPQPLHKTSQFYSSPPRVEFFNKVTAWDVWKTANHSLSDIYNSSVHQLISTANSLYQNSLRTNQLTAHQCGPYCFVLNISDVEHFTGISRSKLRGQTNPPITFGRLHEAVVSTLEQHFCFAMSTIEDYLGMPSFNVTTYEWQQFLPEISWYAIQCRADILVVERSELAELVRTNESTLLNSNLAQLDSLLILPYLNIDYSKRLLEDVEIRNVVRDTSKNTWYSYPLYHHIHNATNFTGRDLEILYNWNSTQIYALQHIPLASYSTCSGVVTLDRTFYNISASILGDSSCLVALVLSRCVRYVSTQRSEIGNLLDLSVLGIFTAATGIDSWIEIADILQLGYEDGLIIDTPRLHEIIRGSTGAGRLTRDDILELSVPQIIAHHISLDDSLYISQKFQPMFQYILSTYGFSSNGLSEASGQPVTNATTITEVHEKLLETVIRRYDVENITSLIGFNKYFPKDLDLVALPSSHWSQIVDAIIQHSFKQVMQAFSYDLEASPNSVIIVPQPDYFQTIRTTKPISYNNVFINRISLCLFKKNNTSFESSSFKKYHGYYNDTIARTMRKKVLFETKDLESLLFKNNVDELEDLEGVKVLESIKIATGLELFEIQCLYGDSIATLLKSGLTWNEIWDTKLCYSFTNLTLLQILRAVRDAPTISCGMFFLSAG